MSEYETIDGITGRYTWLRKRVWFWQVPAFERLGWYRSRSEGGLRPVVIFRIDRHAVADMDAVWGGWV